MVQSAGPIDGDVGVVRCQLGTSEQCACCVPLAVLVHVIEDGTVAVCEAIDAHLILIQILVLHIDMLEAVDVVVAVEVGQINTAHILLVHLDPIHRPLQAIAIDECVRHFDP